MAPRPKTTLAGHTAGIFADMTLDGPEIGTLVVVVDRARNLPNRKTMGKQDPYCAMRLGKEAKKTDTDRRGGQTPRWDQELRFTVHESPDYYKLKVSCFNDDKKTDLIGDAFIDLTDLVKPGGGSNDLWHQLNYKGKYAGDIRMEMTYYDMRPREEKPTDKRRVKDKQSSLPGDNADNASFAPGPKQLGPREIRRRPLPASPGQTPPAAAPEALQQGAVRHAAPHERATEQAASRNSLPSHAPDQQYGSDQQVIHQPSPRNSGYQQEPGNPRQPPMTAAHSLQPADYLSHHSVSASLNDPYSQLFETSQMIRSDPHGYGSSYDTTQTPGLAQQNIKNIASSDFPHNRTSAMRPLPPSVEDVSPIQEDEFQWQDHSHHEPQQYSQQRYQPDFQQNEHFPQISPENNELQLTRSGQYNAQPMQNIGQFDGSRHSSFGAPSFVDEPDGFDVAPTPPQHQVHARNLYSDCPPSAYVSRPSQSTRRRSSVEERSPLQHLERRYDPSTRISNEHATYRHSFHEIEGSSSGMQSSNPPSEDQSQQLVKASHIPQLQTYRNSARFEARPVHRGSDEFIGRPSYDHVASNFGHQQVSQQDWTQPHQVDPARQMVSSSIDDHYEGNGPQSQSQPDLHHGRPPQPRRSQSGDANIHRPIPRKAVSPGRYPDMYGKRLSGVPFGPDAYDVLNPGSSPVTNENTKFETPEQAKQSALLREAERSRGLGPIIGNDGREIDPSDHLPSDTWAPEPERKQRKPEHVIHIRTKNTKRSSVTPGSSPVGQRMPHPRSVPPSPATESPQTISPSVGRNRLQKHSTNRPSPTQHYQPPHVESSPRDEPYEYHDRERQKRNSYHEVRSPPHRPSLSEYQVPATSSYTPRGSTYGHNPPIPPKMPIASSNDSHVYNDPLAAEMSMIDIGPSRGGRTLVRANRGY